MEYRSAPDGTSERQPQLTARESDCLRLLACGLLAAEVRAELGIAQSTLNAHLASARRKLDARTTLQAVLKVQDCSHEKAPDGDIAIPNLDRHSKMFS